MSAPAGQAAATSRRPLYDGLVAAWVVLWLVVGIWTGVEVWRLAALGDSLAESGRALGQVSSGLEVLGRLPVVGDLPDALAGDVRAAADEVVRNGRLGESGLRRLAVLLGLTISVAPVTPVFFSYLPARRRAGRT